MSPRRAAACIVGNVGQNDRAALSGNGPIQRFVDTEIVSPHFFACIEYLPGEGLGGPCGLFRVVVGHDQHLGADIFDVTPREAVAE